MGSRSSPMLWMRLVDALVFVTWFIVLLLAMLPEFESRTVEQFLAIRLSLANFLILLLLVFSWHGALLAFGVYDVSPLTSAQQQWWCILKGVTFAIFGWLLVGTLLQLSFIRIDFLLALWAGTLALMLLSRWVVHVLLRHQRGLDRYLQRLLVVGLNPRAIKLAREMEESPERGYKLIGFVDEAAVGMDCYPLVSDYDGLPDYLRNTAVDEVIVCLPVRSRYHRITEIVNTCQKQGIKVRIVADLLPLGNSFHTVENVAGSALISVHPHAITPRGARIKRLLDVAVSGVLLVLLAPLFVVAAIAIKLSSRGPVFFSQLRLGLNKKTFRMFKFRTMVTNAAELQAELEHLNEVDGPAFKITADPRITPLGRFLRRTSIDELPQLLNVLLGDMSLVGPRPLPVRDYEGFSVDWHRRRFSVRPGISGLWQVAGRSDLPFDEWMALDLKYISEWSLALDLKVLLKTVPAVLRGTGAT